LEKYKTAEQTQAGYFLVIDLGGSDTQLDKVLELEADARRRNSRFSPVHVVDGQKQASASKI
jgi:dihydroxyacetone kinase DhaKLM complex PTS-EIIA-like component DhaM